MTFKLPEPEWHERKGLIFDAFNEDICRSGYDKLYTEAQLKQALKDVLEQAAEFCETNQVNHSFRGGRTFLASDKDSVGTHEGITYAQAIRKMIGEI
jgi:phage tail tube protein FII